MTPSSQQPSCHREFPFPACKGGNFAPFLPLPPARVGQRGQEHPRQELSQPAESNAGTERGHGTPAGTEQGHGTRTGTEQGHGTPAGTEQGHGTHLQGPSGTWPLWPHPVAQVRGRAVSGSGSPWDKCSCPQPGLGNIKWISGLKSLCTPPQSKLHCH